ncbi:MAG: hypothetical protein ACRD9L_01245, partial [Bryobacteraceae bacterium]
MGRALVASFQVAADAVPFSTELCGRLADAVVAGTVASEARAHRKVARAPVSNVYGHAAPGFLWPAMN